MPYEAVIFDLFGTLIDYLPRKEYARAFEGMARALKAPVLPFREAWQERIYGRDTGVYGGIEEDIRHVCASLESHPTDEMIAKAVEIRLELYRRNLAPRDGAIAVLTQLKQQGMKLGLVSDSGSELPRLWPETEFAPLIDAPVFSVEVGVLKPDPRIYQVACERLSMPPERCLYVGDGSSHELTGALHVGMDAVLICVPYDKATIMERTDPQNWKGPIIEHLNDLIGCIDWMASSR